MSVRVTLNCQVKPEQYDRLVPFLEDNLPRVRSFIGNIYVSVLYNRDNAEMLLDEEWQSVENHQAYLAFIGSNGVMDQLAAFLKAPPSIKYFQRLEV